MNGTTTELESRLRTIDAEMQDMARSDMLHDSDSTGGPPENTEWLASHREARMSRLIAEHQTVRDELQSRLPEIEDAVPYDNDLTYDSRHEQFCRDEERRREGLTAYYEQLDTEDLVLNLRLATGAEREVMVDVLEVRQCMFGQIPTR